MGILNIIKSAFAFEHTILMFEKAFKIPWERRITIKLKYKKEKYIINLDAGKYKHNDLLYTALAMQVFKDLYENLEAKNK
jgi:hypothetical protein